MSGNLLEMNEASLGIYGHVEASLHMPDAPRLFGLTPSSLNATENHEVHSTRMFRQQNDSTPGTHDHVHFQVTCLVPQQ
jgi:hypothetical protein